MKRIRPWLTQDRALWIALALWLIGLALAFLTSPVIATLWRALP